MSDGVKRHQAAVNERSCKVEALSLKDTSKLLSLSKHAKHSGPSPTANKRNSDRPDSDINSVFQSEEDLSREPLSSEDEEPSDEEDDVEQHK